MAVTVVASTTANPLKLRQIADVRRGPAARGRGHRGRAAPGARARGSRRRLPGRGQPGSRDLRGRRHDRPRARPRRPGARRRARRPRRWRAGQRCRLRRCAARRARRVIGVQPAGAPAMALSWRRARWSRPTASTRSPTASPGAARSQRCSTTCSWCSTTSYWSARTRSRPGCALIHEHAGLVVEPSAALGVAAVLEASERFAGRRVTTVLCGTNVDPATSRAGSCREAERGSAHTTWSQRDQQDPGRPSSRELLARDLTRLAYVAPDGTPRTSRSRSPGTARRS